MIWALYLRRVDSQILKRVVARAFAVVEAEIDLADSYSTLPTGGAVGVVVWSGTGEFPVTVEVAPGQSPANVDELTLAKEISREMATSVLISDVSREPGNFASMTLIQPDGQVRAVWLDADRLQNDELCLAHDDG
jgi:hypothetical protein